MRLSFYWSPKNKRFKSRQTCFFQFIRKFHGFFIIMIRQINLIIVIINITLHISHSCTHFLLLTIIIITLVVILMHLQIVTRKSIGRMTEFQKYRHKTINLLLSQTMSYKSCDRTHGTDQSHCILEFPPFSTNIPTTSTCNHQTCRCHILFINPPCLPLSNRLLLLHTHFFHRPTTTTTTTINTSRPIRLLLNLHPQTLHQTSQQRIRNHHCQTPNRLPSSLLHNFTLTRQLSHHNLQHNQMLPRHKTQCSKPRCQFRQ
mmetsp:Transcript_14442/g.27161  ORF Transcript_14442/g.27161 Transcript_14442/m.27161 type:complete len:259 (-) Transcript_14442:776-1552(-)